MRCANEECKQVVVEVNYERRYMAESTGVGHVRSWLAVPQYPRGKPLPDDVRENYRKDYREAAAIIDRSPRASAVLSRRLLADLLEEYAGRKEFNLETRIDRFNEETSRPYELRKNLHYLREIGNFIHTQRDKDDQASIVDVTKEEAEWTLRVIEDLFDYFIITPSRNAKMRSAIDMKLDRVDRKPIKALPEDEPSGDD
jgi:hypothetical protein